MQGIQLLLARGSNGNGERGECTLAAESLTVDRFLIETRRMPLKDRQNSAA